MPSSSRRTGSAHTSKGRSQGNGKQDIGSSSSLLQEPSSSSQRQPASQVTFGNDVNRIAELLEKFDQQSEPLTLDGSDGKLRSLRNDWAGMEGNFEIAYQLITQVGERLAEARAAEGLIDEDENMQEMDVGMRGMIDLQESVKHRRRALEEIRAEVAKGTEVMAADEMYKSRTQELIDEYYLKTVRQRYVQSKPYQIYKAAVWEALREDDMPPLADLLPNEGNEGEEDDDDDDEIVAYGGVKQKFKCPITLQIMVNPLKSTVCQHAFEKESILELLGSSTKPCPTGCNKQLSKRTLIEDPVFTRACRKYARREQIRKETQKTQAQATMLD